MKEIVRELTKVPFGIEDIMDRINESGEVYATEEELMEMYYSDEYQRYLGELFEIATAEEIPEEKKIAKIIERGYMDGSGNFQEMNDFIEGCPGIYISIDLTSDIRYLMVYNNDKLSNRVGPAQFVVEGISETEKYCEYFVEGKRIDSGKEGIAMKVIEEQFWRKMSD